MKKAISDWSLQLFSEGAAQGAEAGEGTQGAEAAAQQTDGQETQSAEIQQTEEKAKTPDEEFEELIQGQYKESFQNRTQKIINERFKHTKNLESEVERNKAINEAIAVKYGIDPTNTDALLQAVKGDESYLETAAYENGMTVDAFREKLEGDRAKRELAQIRQQQQREQLAQAIKTEENRIRETYSDKTFNFWGEYNSNPEFKRMVDGRVPIETAYRIINQEKIIAAAEKKAGEKARKSVADDIIANGQRPVEGGVKGQPPASSKIDVNSLTDEQMDKYLEMARQGHKVTFR